MRVELIYDKRNVAGLPNAHAMITAELTKRVHRVFPDAEIKVKAMQANGLNSDANKQDKSVLNRLVEEMFDDADEWLTHSDY
ncbi:DinI family protein [Chimaeribacter arupi]|uniref:DinI family protein n=3 Tax=Yersiniaceae TaxID=1903411 RepID=A0A2N5EPS0_9GAMM|nr:MULTISPECIES: DinI-like family protein [Yersiniaceae]MBS0970212.1 DinI family protein [Nissabacter archeti]MDV5140538.1 DinI-like family protein [Chimaeribacter arupi]PLR32888.1 DinI family protein [Chimaeribacter coloradensis]PLR38994.1 DinI family protein [Chimaeribacter arupi]PLR49905.1 DinI family protein [Chimaeribacter arupi]